ncbi:MAG: sugar ABC transporter permease [Candidatus Galacturonibacter soehngenii]|nr:sugar ABC transporter permease [Candidatus Galacturonibacter soehngenii]
MDEVTESKLTFHEMGKKRFSSRKVQKNVVIILFLFAPLLLLIVFTYMPFTDMVRYSFFKWNGTSKTMKYIGVKNYIEVFTRPEYFGVLKTSLYYLVGSFVQIGLALYFATILNFKVRFSNFFKGAIFFPYLINGVAIGFVFLYFFKSGGTLNSILTAFGVAEEKIPLWLNNRSLINVSLAFVSVWRYMGQNMVMFSGAMASVNSDLYEASELDGANRWQQFRYIILPNIKLVVSLNMILAVKGAISVFEIPYIMTNGGNGSATFVTKTLETAFTMKKVGLASAMGVVLLIFILIITLIQKKFFEGKEA